jgi:pimeloyl-ACP methyl ester carboxylesterase
MWAPQLDALSERFTVINVDFRGHGQTPMTPEGTDPAMTGPLSIRDLTRDMLTVLDQLGYERAIFGGLSMGGMASLRAALDHPDRVRALMVFDSDGGRESRLRILKLKAMLHTVRVIGVEPFMSQVAREMFGRTTLKTNPELIDAWIPRFRGVSLDTMGRYLYMLEHRDSVLHRMASIGIPTLIVCGEEDKALPPRHSEAIAAAIPGSQLHLVQEAGHLCTLEQPDVVTGLMLDFLERAAIAD